jgi:hypothetical protein
VLLGGGAVDRARVAERRERQPRALEQLERDEAVLAAAAEREQLGRAGRRARGSRRRRVGRCVDESRPGVVGQVVLPAPLRPHAPEDRRPQLDETRRRVAREPAELDRVGLQARDRVDLEQRHVKREAIDQVVAVLARQLTEVDILVPDREVKPHVVELAGGRDRVAGTFDLANPEHAHW